MVSPPSAAAPRPTRHRPDRRRALRLISCAVLALALALPACADDTEADCQATYRHLLTVAHRNHDPEVMESFVTACLDHYDPKRLQCLREASTPGAALACKPFKKRPD